jgi:hypothetical protein
VTGFRYFPLLSIWQMTMELQQIPLNDICNAATHSGVGTVLHFVGSGEEGDIESMALCMVMQPHGV